MLPFGYREGKQYPTVLWVYPSTVYGDRPQTLWRWVDAPGPYSMQFLAGHGYAVLFPSMGLPPHGTKRDIYMELPKGVLPAIDEAVRIGIADPDRIGLLGASFGGYATYGLLTQTNRFQAAVSMCGPANLVSLWGAFGTFDLRSRYDDYAHEDLYRMQNVEGSLGPATPPYNDLAAYLRNSPITYANRIETPLMIMQGDLDGIGIEQGEEMFSALYRQGKRARFVRYWGEGHTIMSPANVRDMWKQIVDWFDEYLKAPEKTVSRRH